MISKQDILNSAWRRLGYAKSQDSYASYVEGAFDFGVESLINEHYWTFAQKSLSLGLVSNTCELPPYQYKYLLPLDLCAVIKISNGDIIDNSYAIIDKYLYSNNNPVTLLYTANSFPNDQFPGHFGEALAYYIAKECALVVSKTELFPMLTQAFELALANAIAIDSRNVPTQIMRNDYYITQRYI